MPAPHTERHAPLLTPKTKERDTNSSSDTKGLDPKQIKLKVFNFSNYSEAAKASHIGERFSGLILDELVKRDMQSRVAFIDTLLKRSLDIFMYRNGPPTKDIAYLNELAPAVLVQGYVEDAPGQPDFRAHTRVNFIDRRVTTHELGNMLKHDGKEGFDITLSPLFVETVDFSIGDMERYAKDHATEIYASIAASWAELANESERLISHLESNDPSDYLKAGAELILFGMSAVPQLLEALDASEGIRKERIVLVLGEMRVGKLLPVYQRLLADPSSDVVLACLSAIRKLANGSHTRSPRTVEMSHWRLPEASHDWWTVKELPGFTVGSRSLRGSELTGTIPAGCDLLDHKEMAVMKAALVLLSDLPADPNVISCVNDALAQSHDRTRSDLHLLTLGRLGHRPVTTALSEVAHRRTDRYGQLAAVYLGRLRERSADDVLIGLVDGEDREMRVAAAEALNGTRSLDAISPLTANIKEYEPFGDTLASIGEPAVPALVRLLRESDDAILAARAAEVLGKIGGEEALHALLETLQQVNRQLPGEEIEQALGAIGDQRALRPLFNAYTRGYYSNYSFPNSVVDSPNTS